MFHYILGAMTLLFSCILFIHLAVGIFLMVTPAEAGPPFPSFIGRLFVAVAAVIILAGWTLGALLLAAGGNVRQRRARGFRFAIACLDCVMVPLGTVLGVFTILQLNKEPVQRLFAV